MPPRKRKADEVEEKEEQEVPAAAVAAAAADIEVPTLPEPTEIPMPTIEESPQQDMGALAAAAAAAVAVTQPPPPVPPMTNAQIIAATAATTPTTVAAAATTPTTIAAAAAAADPAVSRKEKSLAVLCLNFMAVARESPFNSEGMKIIEIQQIAERLAAKRRRIYDIINILESVCIVSRVKKNTYQWHGMDGLPAMFASLQKEGLEEMAAKEAEAAAAAAAGGVAKVEGDKPEGQQVVVENIGGKDQGCGQDV